MHGFVIDPIAKTITKVEVNFNPINPNYNLLNKQIYEFIDATCYDVVRINDHGDFVHVDDDGAITPGNAHWSFKQLPEVKLFGKGFVFGSDENGESAEPRCTLEWLQACVAFTNYESTGHLSASSQGYEIHPTLGKVFVHNGGQPIIRKRLAK